MMHLTSGEPSCNYINFPFAETRKHGDKLRDKQTFLLSLCLNNGGLTLNDVRQACRRMLRPNFLLAGKRNKK
jgi:hypothetical protein